MFHPEITRLLTQERIDALRHEADQDRMAASFAPDRSDPVTVLAGLVHRARRTLSFRRTAQTRASALHRAD